jgi:prephenate dehydratase
LIAVNIADVFSAVERGRVTYGVVPFENSTVGGIALTFDRFLTTDLKVRAETYLPVRTIEFLI